ncbi:hypothetical protein F5141DRAFT_1204323 [Pisolithus sp. B1]|nr:hypothetical protein F5141DRAFT_1204323 [Pisolithus sp. B1]
MSTLPYLVFFTGRDDPRDCMVIGEDEKPVFFEFETTDMCTTVGTVAARATFLAIDSPLSPSIGRAVIPGSVSAHFLTLENAREVPIERLIMPGSSPHARRFVSATDDRVYEWRRSYEDPTSYELWAGPNAQIAIFHKFQHSTPVGMSHATLQYCFTDGLLLIEALVTLNLNRWLDLNMSG